MGIGTGATFFAAGAVLFWAVDVDLPFIEDNTLGAILMIVGAVAVAAGVLINAQRGQKRAGSGLGSGVAMIAVGAILYWAVDVDLPFVFDGALGVILMIGGLISVVATVAMQASGSRTRHVVERRY